MTSAIIRRLSAVLGSTALVASCLCIPAVSAQTQGSSKADKPAAKGAAAEKQAPRGAQRKRTRQVVFTEGVTHRVETFKTVGDVELQVHIYEREDRDRSVPVPAIVFFFGGGWMSGSPGQFYHHADHLASRGMVAMSAEYRVNKRHQTTPFECVKDGRSMVRWIRDNAERLGVDPDRVAAGGGSAGGHVAAATATITNVDEEGEDLSISAVPDALVLFNPVIDTTMTGYQNGAKRLRDRAEEISPVHHVTDDLPPTLIFHGTKDSTVPFENVQRFEKQMMEAGNRCEVVPFEEKGHGFFNWMRDPDNASYLRTIALMDAFLEDLGWLPVN